MSSLGPSPEKKQQIPGGNERKKGKNNNEAKAGPSLRSG